MEALGEKGILVGAWGAGTLAISNGAVVDAKDLRPKAGIFTLATYASRSAPFADENVTITNGIGKVIQTDTDITVCIYPQASTLIIR